MTPNQDKPRTKLSNNLDGTSGVNETSRSNTEAADFQCVICHECPSNAKNVATISGCSHRFCFDCIKRWAAVKTVCPLCGKCFKTITSDGTETEVEARANNDEYTSLREMLQDVARASNDEGINSPRMTRELEELLDDVRAELNDALEYLQQQDERRAEVEARENNEDEDLRRRNDELCDRRTRRHQIVAHLAPDIVLLLACLEDLGN